MVRCGININFFNEKPFLAAPHNLALILNLDWFTPFKHIQYSIGILYAVVANLPKSERYKLENVNIIGCIPGPKRTKEKMLIHLVKELPKLWEGVYLKTSSLFTFIPVRCALICVTCDLPATRKLCEFSAVTSFRGC